MATPARRIAAEVLMRVAQDGAFANLALDGARRPAAAPRRARGWRTLRPARRASRPRPRSAALASPCAASITWESGPTGICLDPRTATPLVSPGCNPFPGAGFGGAPASVELPGDLLTPFGVFC